MNRRNLIVTALGGGLAVWLMAQNASAPPAADPVAAFPRGAMLALEFRDFAGLLKEWNGSGVKREWLTSDAYRQFAVSRLAQRLQEAQGEFADAAKVPVNLTSLEQIAGDRTALALYNPSDLEFVFATRTPEARFAASLLGQQRGRLQPRNAAGMPYFVSSNPVTRRTVAFAIRGEYLLVATSENLLAETLIRFPQPNDGGLAGEEWYRRAVRVQQQQPGEIRMTGNIDALYQSPHFRSYWIQRNRAALTPFLATISDLDRQAGVWTERRTLIRKQSSSASAPADLSALLRSVPATAGLYRAWANPDPNEAADLVIRKLAAPANGAPSGPDNAPDLAAIENAGDESAWEDRIDEAPFVAAASGVDAARLRRFFAAAPLTGLLHVQSTRNAPDNVWIEQDIAIVLTRQGNWDPNAVRTEIDALETPIQFAVQGNTLYLANRAPALAALRTTNPGISVPPSTRFAGGFRHAAERDRFARWMARIDQPTAEAPQPGQERQPMFLTDTVAGLSRVLRGVTEQTVVVSDLGDRVQQTIAYRMQ